MDSSAARESDVESPATEPRTYPWETELADLRVTFRRMTAEDAPKVLAFTKELPERDLLFLRYDITDPEVVEEWVANIARGRTQTILAEEQGHLMGYCSLLLSDILWTRHLGEIQMLVGPNYRGKGVGGHLARQIFDFARQKGLQKVVAHMMSTQRDGQSLFQGLGFIPEALLNDWAIDRAGRTHDMIMMSREVEEGSLDD